MSCFYDSFVFYFVVAVVVVVVVLLLLKIIKVTQIIMFMSLIATGACNNYN